MRRMLAAVLVVGVGVLGFSLMDLQAQVEPLAPIGPNEKPIAQTRPPVPAKAEPPAPRVEPVILAPEVVAPLTPPADKLETATPANQAPGEPMGPPKPVEPALALPGLEPPLATPAPKPVQPPMPLTTPEPVKIPPPERAIPLPKQTAPELPRMPKLEEDAPRLAPVAPAPAAAPTPRPEPKAEVKPEIKPEVKAEIKPEAKPHSRAVAPAVSVEVRAPETVGINQPLQYEIVVKNVGPVTVHQIKLEDELPRSVKYLGGEPPAEVQGEKMVWGLGTLDAGGEKLIKVSVKPSAEGDWRTKPSVSFMAQVTPLQVTVTRPKLQVAVSCASESAYVGEEVPMQIEIKNAGTGTAEKVILRAQLSEGLFHPQAREAHNRVIEAELANLAAGETRSVTLKVKVQKAGSQGCMLSAVCDGSPEATGRTTLQAMPPAMALKIQGPQRALVRTEPTFTLEVANTERTPSASVQVAAAFPEGFEFVSATEGGTYDAERRVLTWGLGPLQGGQKRQVTVRARANATGNWAIRAVAQAGPRQEARAEWVVQTEGIPGLSFEVTSKENPVEVGKDAVYEIRIVNQGTSPCTNLRLAAAMSEGMTPSSAMVGDAVLPFRLSGQALIFEPIPKLAGQGEMVIRLKARSTQAGDQRCKVQVGCDQLKQPIVKEESTFFFAP